jgi:hypothetical protein
MLYPSMTLLIGTWNQENFIVEYALQRLLARNNNFAADLS